MLVRDWKHLTIGSNINAVLHAFKTKSYLLLNSDPAVHSLDVTDNQIDVGLKTYPAGSLIEDVWSELLYEHSMEGLNPFGRKVKSARFIPEDNKLKLATESGNLFIINYEKATVFDLQNVHNLPDSFKEEIAAYRVFDWFDVRSGMLHDYDIICDEDSPFVNRIKFFISKRIDGNKDKKDLVSESFLSSEQIKDFNYSDTYARFKTEKILKESGLTGVKSGFQSGKQVAYVLRLEVVKRELRKLNMNLYEDTKNIKFKYESEVQNKISSCSYVNKLNNILKVV